MVNQPFEVPTAHRSVCEMCEAVACGKCEIRTTRAEAALVLPLLKWVPTLKVSIHLR